MASRREKRTEEMPTSWTIRHLIREIIVVILSLSTAAVLGHQYVTTTKKNTGVLSLNRIQELNVADEPSHVVPKERGKFLSDRVTDEELYTAYLEIKEEYKTKALSCDTVSNDHPSSSRCPDGTWNVVNRKDDIEIAMLRHPSDPTCPYVRFTSIMPGTIDDVWDFLRLENWDTSLAIMDPFYEGLDIVKRYEYQLTSSHHSPLHRFSTKTAKRVVEMTLARKRTKRLFAFGKRDFSFVSVSDIPREEDGVWISGMVTVRTAAIPRANGYTRGFQDSVGFYEALDPVEVVRNDSGGNGKSGVVLQPRMRLTIVCRMDLNDSAEGGEGGAIPMWLYVKTIGTTGMGALVSLEKEIAKMTSERYGKMNKEEAPSRKRGERIMKFLLKPFTFWFSRKGNKCESNLDETIVGSCRRRNFPWHKKRTA